MVLNKSEFFLMQHRSTHAASLAFACSCRYVAPGLNQSDGLPGHPSNFFSDREPQTGSLFAYWLVIHTAIWLAPSNFREGNFTNHDNTYAYMHLSSTSCSHDVDFVLILHVPPNILSFFLSCCRIKNDEYYFSWIFMKTRKVQWVGSPSVSGKRRELFLC